jgi:hypothetical protein
MPNKTSSFISARRHFLKSILPTGALFCLGCKNLLALPDTYGGQQTAGQKPKFLENSGMNMKDVYTFAYGTFIPVYQIMANNVGREKFLEMLKKATAENQSQMVNSMVKDMLKRDMKAFADLIVNIMSSAPFDKAFAFEVAENSEKAFELRFTECLPARISREMKAEDIGYALECYPASAVGRAFNSKMRWTNPKSLMKGDDICIERFTLEG